VRFVGKGWAFCGMPGPFVACRGHAVGCHTQFSLIIAVFISITDIDEPSFTFFKLRDGSLMPKGKFILFMAVLNQRERPQRPNIRRLRHR
jgi:hypothetical protein